MDVTARAFIATPRRLGKVRVKPQPRAVDSLSMERRAFSRIRQRIPCEVVHGDRHIRAILVDVSPGGAFLQLESNVGIGEAVEIWFADAHFAPQVARARIVRRRLVSGLVAALMRPGLGIAWIEAPPFALRDAVAPSGLIEVEIDVHGHEDLPVALPETELREPVELAPDAPAPEVSAPVAAISGEPEPAGHRLDLSPAAVSAEVVVIDEGELGEIAALLAQLGVTPHRMRWGAQAEPAHWAALPRLVIASARVALNVPIDDVPRSQGVRGVAVCDSPSLVLQTQLHRQGYDLIVQRESHPETLRLFFGALLHRRPELRREKRRAFGAPARVWRGWRPFAATILDVASGGASVLIARAAPRGTRLRVRVAGAYTGGQALSVLGVVERVAANGDGAILGLRFEAIPQRKRERLDALIARLDAGGPVADPSTAASVAEGRALRRGERRKLPRQLYRGPILELDGNTDAVRNVLVGTDLSLGGMRIEPHPGLQRGQRLRVALQAPTDAEPIVLAAEVARDEGARGLALRFVDMTESAQISLRRLLDETAEIQRAKRDRSGESERLVLGRLLPGVVSGG